MNDDLIEILEELTEILKELDYISEYDYICLYDEPINSYDEFIDLGITIDKGGYFEWQW